MAKGRIEQTIAIKVDGLDDVKQIDKQIDALTKQKAKLTVDADTKGAQKQLDAIDAELDALNKRKAQLTVDANTDDAKRDLDALFTLVDKLGSSSARIVLQDNAKDIQREIADLLLDLDKLSDPEQIQIKIDQINELEGQLGKIETQVDELGSRDIDIKTGSARRNIDDLGKSADSSKSVLANMVGNATQDLGALGGIAGSAGVAIGQMGEYMADAAADGDKLGTIVRNFGKIAGPVAGIALFTEVLGKMVAAGKEVQELSADRAQGFFEAIRAGTDAFAAMREEIEKTGELDFGKPGGGFLGIAPGIESILPLLDKARIRFDDWQRMIEEWPTKSKGYIASLKEAGLTQGEAEDVLIALMQATGAKQAADEKAADTTRFLSDETKSYRAVMQGLAQDEKARVAALDAADEAQRAKENTQAYLDQAAGLAKATEAAKAYDRVIGSIDFRNTDIDGAVSAMSKFHEQFFGLRNIASDFEAAFDGLQQSLEKNTNTFDLNTEAGRENQAAVEDLASSVDTTLAAAYADANGNFDVFNAKATDVANTLKTRLMKEMDLSSDEADEMIRVLGLMPDDIETRYKLSGTEEAKLKLQLLDDQIAQLPKDVQAKITQQIITGDYVGAVQTVQDYYNRHPGHIPTKADDPDNQQAVLNSAQAYFNRHPLQIKANFTGGPQLAGAEGFASSPPGAYAGEAGPEFIRRPGRPEELLTYPAFIPPGTRVTSARRTRTILMRRGGLRRMASGGIAPALPVMPVTVQINAAVVGNRYDVAKAVGQGVRDLHRLIGTRGSGVGRG